MTSSGSLSGAPLEQEFEKAMSDLSISDDDQNAIRAFLSLLKQKNSVTLIHYEHSLRVGLLSRQIAEFTHHNARALFFAGTLHDLGKCQVDVRTLGKTGVWEPKDYREIRHHVMDGYRLLKNRFDFTAETIIWHHKFQHDGYPKKLPPPLHEYSTSSKLLIAEHGRFLAIADVYDALHRSNSKFGEQKTLSGQEIKEKMLQFNPDRKELVTSLYDSGIFVV